MRRRDFVSASLAAGVGFAAAPAAQPLSHPAQGHDGTPFRLDFAPHLGQFSGLSGNAIEDQLAFMHAEGFRAIEDNTFRLRPPAEQQTIVRTLARLGMRMGVFVAVMPDWGSRAPMLTAGDDAYNRFFLDEVQAASDLAADSGVTWMTIVPGHLHGRLPFDLQTANVIDTLRRAADIVAPRGQVLVIENLNSYTDHPQIFLQSVRQAYVIARAVDSPGLKVLADLYHEQVMSGNLLDTLAATWPEVAYVQVGDVPGRREPTTGEVNYGNVFRWLAEKGYTGIVGMEHGAAEEGPGGQRAVIDAYRSLDPVAETRLFKHPTTG